MISELRTQATVQPGGLVEIRSAELPEGATVEIVLSIKAPAHEETRDQNLLDFIGAAKGLFYSVEDVDTYIREARGLWDYCN